MTAAARWPYPGDSELARARRVAQAYREHLHTANPGLCAALDEAMRDYGEGWILPKVTTCNLDDWLSVAEACDLAAVKPATLRQWRARGRLSGSLVDGQWLYRARDVLAVLTEVRRRKPRAGVADHGT